MTAPTTAVAVHPFRVRFFAVAARAIHFRNYGDHRIAVAAAADAEWKRSRAKIH